MTEWWGQQYRGRWTRVVDHREAARWAISGRGLQLAQEDEIPSELRLPGRIIVAPRVVPGRFCRWCHRVPSDPRRRTWCGPDCLDRFLTLTDPAYIRRQVAKRDHGVCLICGFDTAKLQRVLRSIEYALGREVLKLLELSSWRSWWEADHIRPRHLGGSNELSNLRTLCCPCHKAVTANQAGERAAARYDAKATLWGAMTLEELIGAG